MIFESRSNNLHDKKENASKSQGFVYKIFHIIQIKHQETYKALHTKLSLFISYIQFLYQYYDLKTFMTLKLNQNPKF